IRSAVIVVPLRMIHPFAEAACSRRASGDCFNWTFARTPLCSSMSMQTGSTESVIRTVSAIAVRIDSAGKVVRQGKELRKESGTVGRFVTGEEDWNLPLIIGRHSRTAHQ